MGRTVYLPTCKPSKSTIHVGKYTIHGWYGLCIHVWYICLHGWLTFMVNVGKYTIHGSYGIVPFFVFSSAEACWFWCNWFGDAEIAATLYLLEGRNPRLQIHSMFFKHAFFCVAGEMGIFLDWLKRNCLKRPHWLDLRIYIFMLAGSPTKKTWCGIFCICRKILRV